jgi:hypothetical protein
MHTSSWIPQLRSSAAREAPASSTSDEGAKGATNASHHQSVFWQRANAARRARTQFAERTRSSHTFWQAAACAICEKGRARRASGRGERREEQAGTSAVTQKKFQVMQKGAFFSTKSKNSVNMIYWQRQMRAEGRNMVTTRSWTRCVVAHDDV